MRSAALFVLLALRLAAQPVPPTWDTLCYQKFRSNLIIGIFQSYRNFDNEFQQYMVRDTAGVSHHNYSAESKLITGVDLTYDKFSIALGLRSTPQEGSGNRGKTKTFNTHLRFGGNKWLIENTIRHFKGFYDLNTSRYDTTFHSSGKYFYQPSFINTLVRTKFLYFTNHKRFSIRSGFSCNYRQVKSAVSWVLSANINHNSMRNDSSFFPVASRDLYRDHGGMSGLNVLGISVNGGAAGTLVLWRAFFIQVMFIVGPEQQWRKYFYGDRQKSLSYISLSGDLRGSIGLNFKRWYLFSFSSNDFALYNSSFVGLENRSVSGGLTIGFRLNSRTPAFYRKFQKTRLYQSI